MRIKWAHLCAGPPLQEGPYWSVGPVTNAVELKSGSPPTIPQKYHVVLAIEAHHNEAAADKAVLLQLINDEEQVTRSFPLGQLAWRDLGPAFPLLAVRQLNVSGSPLGKPGKYHFTLSVPDDVADGKLEFYVLPHDGGVLPKGAELAEHGFELTAGHIAGNVTVRGSILLVERITDFFVLSGQLLRGFKGYICGWIDAGSAEKHVQNLFVELRDSDGALLGTYQSPRITFSQAGPGQSWHAFFAFPFELKQLLPVGEYEFVVYVGGQRLSSSIEYWLIPPQPPVG